MFLTIKNNTQTKFSVLLLIGKYTFDFFKVKGNSKLHLINMDLEGFACQISLDQILFSNKRKGCSWVVFHGKMREKGTNSDFNEC